LEHDRRLIDRLKQSQISEDGIREILLAEDLYFSDDSVRNIAYGLMIFRESVGELFREPFLIYGSTAKGTAGVEPKIQEIQYWDDLHFWGSTFRIYGKSDLDIRCIARNPKDVFDTITKSKDILSPFTLGSAGIRVDSEESVKEDILRTNTPSFYRRLLLLNSLIVFSGQDTVATLTELGRDYLTQDDINYEKEMGEVRAIVRSKLETSEAVFLDSRELNKRFPVFYSEANLIIKNFQRTHSFKISFSLRESSLVVVKAGSMDECLQFNSAIYENSKTSFGDICRAIDNNTEKNM